MVILKKYSPRVNYTQISQCSQILPEDELSGRPVPTEPIRSQNFPLIFNGCPEDCPGTAAGEQTGPCHVPSGHCKSLHCVESSDDYQHFPSLEPWCLILSGAKGFLLHLQTHYFSYFRDPDDHEWFSCALALHMSKYQFFFIFSK